MAAKLDMAKRLYEFGEFCLDPGSGTLRRNGEIISLPPRVFDTLALLVQRHGEILTKREMLDEVWKEAFVEEANLTQNVYLLRRTLGKDANGKEWIETLPRKGYTFVGLVSVVGGEQALEADKPNEKLRGFSNKIKIVGSVAALGLVVGTALLLLLSTKSRDGELLPAKDVTFQKLTFSGDVEFPVISPDGKSFAFSRDGHLFIQAIGSEAPRSIVLPDELTAGFLQFMPDSRTIAFRSQLRFYLPGNAYKVSVDGGDPELLADSVWGGIGFSPDGKFMSFVRDIPDENRHQLIVRELSTKGERVLGELMSPSRFIFVGSPAWSPDGSKIAVAVNKQEGNSYRVQLSVYDTASGRIEEFAPSRLKQFEQAIWLPDGKAVAVIARENQKFFQIWDLTYPIGKLSRITNDLNIYRGLSMSADGTKFLSSNYTTFSHVWTAGADDFSSLKQLTFGNLNRDGTLGMQWMPDASVVYSSRVFGNVDMWRVGPGELEKVQLTREAGDVNASPSLTSDRRTLYFSSTRTGTTQIWRMNAVDGADQTQITFGEAENNSFPQISKAGDWLYYLKKTKNETAIWRRSLVNGAEGPLAVEGKLAPESFLALSPDGKWIATCDLSNKTDATANDQMFQIALVSTSDMERPRIFKIPSEWVTWSPDGISFLYVEDRAGDSVVWRRRLDGQAAQKLFEIKGEHIAGMEWSPDATTLAISKGKRLNDVVLIASN